MSTGDMERGPRISADVVAAVALFAIAGVLLSQTGDDLRDWVLPRTLNYLLIGVGAVLLMKGLVRPGDTVPAVPRLTRGNGLDVVLFVAVAVGYVAIMPIVGFWLTSAVVIFVLSLALAESRTLRTVLVSAAAAVGICAVFYVLMLYVFYVPLPEGILPSSE
jgi:putative tricarboxylic transport membrane protein